MLVTDIAPENTDQARAWDGDEGDDWVAFEEHYDAFARYYRPRLNEAAGIRPQERVLDVGCGCAQSTRDAAHAARAGSALGVDLSAKMIRRAEQRAREEGLANASFLQADAQAHPFEPASFDVAISRFGAIFFGDRLAAFRNIGRALSPGGRLALLGWQAPRPGEFLAELFGALDAGRGLPPPEPGQPVLGLADADRVRELLAQAGFAGIEMADVREKVYLGRDGDDAFDFFERGVGIVRGLLHGLDGPARAAALDRLRRMMNDHQTAEGVVIDSRCWLVSARRA